MTITPRRGPARRRRALPGAIALGLAALPGLAAAGGLDFDLIGARAIGRAGTTLVSGDGGAALVTDPAGLARSTSLRVQLGVAVHDDDTRFRAPDAAATGSPTVLDRSAPDLVPTVAVQGALGPVVVGAAYLELGHLDRLLPAPELNQPLGVLFPHRYGGLALRYRRRTAVVGAAMRAGDWLGLGVSVGASDVELGERRRIWAGFAGRDTIGAEARDLDLQLSGRDRLVPFAAAGALVAPPALPLELAASLSWSADANLGGELTLDPTAASAIFPRPAPSGEGEPTAEARLAMPTTLRAGVRYLGERFLVELEGDMVWFGAAGAVPVWTTAGMGVADQSGVTAMLGEVPSLAAQRDHASVRGAVDVELVPGLLWATAGYAYSSGATGRAHISPGFGDLAGHTASLGAEATWNQMTFTIGIARRFSPSVAVSPAESDVVIENPFDAGTATAGAGRHGRAHDAVGLTMEVAWE